MTDNYGAPWTHQAVMEVRQLFHDGNSVPEIALAMGRTKSAILGVLAKEGLVQWDSNVKQYFSIKWHGR